MFGHSAASGLQSVMSIIQSINRIYACARYYNILVTRVEEGTVVGSPMDRGARVHKLQQLLFSSRTAPEGAGECLRNKTSSAEYFPGIDNAQNTYSSSAIRTMEKYA